MLRLENCGDLVAFALDPGLRELEGTGEIHDDLAVHHSFGVQILDALGGDADFDVVDVAKILAPDAGLFRVVGSPDGGFPMEQISANFA